MTVPMHEWRYLLDRVAFKGFENLDPRIFANLLDVAYLETLPDLTMATGTSSALADRIIVARDVTVADANVIRRGGVLGFARRLIIPSGARLSTRGANGSAGASSATGTAGVGGVTAGSVSGPGGDGAVGTTVQNGTGVAGNTPTAITTANVPNLDGGFSAADQLSIIVANGGLASSPGAGLYGIGGRGGGGGGGAASGAGAVGGAGGAATGFENNVGGTGGTAGAGAGFGGGGNAALVTAPSEDFVRMFMRLFWLWYYGAATGGGGGGSGGGGSSGTLSTRRAAGSGGGGEGGDPMLWFVDELISEGILDTDGGNGGDGGDAANQSLAAGGAASGGGGGAGFNGLLARRVISLGVVRALGGQPGAAGASFGGRQGGVGAVGTDGPGWEDGAVVIRAA